MRARPPVHLARLAAIASAAVAIAAVPSAFAQEAPPTQELPARVEEPNDTAAPPQPTEPADPVEPPPQVAPAEEAQADPAPAPRRTLVWDRTRELAELFRLRNAAERRLDELAQTRGERNPDLMRARREVEILNRQIREAEDAAAGGTAAAPRPTPAPPPIVLEKAAYFGVATSPATPVLQKQLKLPEGVGLVVDFIEPGSPAEAAGLQPYDLLIRFDEQILINPQQLAVLVRATDPGQEVRLRVLREGEETVLPLTLVERDVKPLSRVVFWNADGRPVPAATTAPALTPNAAGADERTLVPGGVLTVTVRDLEGPGLKTIKTMRVGPDGTIRLPYLDAAVRAQGLTPAQLEKAIREAYRGEKVLEQARVHVAVPAPQETRSATVTPVIRDVAENGSTGAAPKE